MNQDKRRVGIAFQGGGFLGGAIATGAVTYLVEHQEFERHTITAFSGTSSGALVATLCWGHMLKNDIQGLPEALKGQWLDLAYGTVPDAQTAELLELGDSVAELNPLYQSWSRRAVVPYFRQTYQDWVRRHINLPEYAKGAAEKKPMPKLRIGATDILHGRPKIFTEKELSFEVLSATGSLDDVIGITEMKNGAHKEAFIDGAWATNPPLRALLDCGVDEIWLIEVFPRHWSSTPRSAMESKSRRDELWQCALIWQELHYIQKVNQWIKDKTFAPGHQYRVVDVRRMEMNQEDLMIGAIYVNDPWFMAKMMDFGYRNAATLFGRPDPGSSPFVKEIQVHTPVCVLSRTAKNMTRWVARTIAT